MSVVSSYGIEEIKISDNESILLETKGEDGYFWVEVIFKTNDDYIFIGSYYTYDYGVGQEWMEYNSDIIAIAGKNLLSSSIEGVQIETLFDMKTRCFIDGSKEELLDYYNQQFGNKKSRCC